MSPAFRPWSSASWPSVAETVLWLISFRSIGRAPICRNFARSWASWIVKSPEIWAPVRPSIPSGFSAKLMIGRRRPRRRGRPRSGRRTAGRPRRATPDRLRLPRWAIRLVTSWNASRPSSVNSKVTLGWLVVGSAAAAGCGSRRRRAPAGPRAARTSRGCGVVALVLGVWVAGGSSLTSALRHRDDLAARRLLAVGLIDEEVAPAGLRAGDQPLVVCGVEQVEGAAGGRAGPRSTRVLLRGDLDRVVEAVERRLRAARSPGAAGLGMTFGSQS